jgi:competence protein ComEA
MAGFGAVGTDDEFTAILDYLVKNFPSPVNVNKATAEQLESGLGLSTAEAEAVIQYREKNGDFKSIDDLKKVPDLDAGKLDAKKARLAF